MKSLVLLSFSLAFLTHGFADDSSAEQPSQPANAEISRDNPAITVDASASEQQTQSSMSVKSEESEWCLSPYHEAHASIRHNEANGIGYKHGYTTLEAFWIYDGYGSGLMPFVDFRGHVFNDGKLAGNLGVGERTLFESINHTFGSYLYYDVRRVGHGLTVNQLSPGLELVGERMEYRINGYFPLGKQKGHEYGFRFDKFSGHDIILKGKQQQAMTGFDAEVGAHIPQSTRHDLYVGAGPYYFKSSDAQAWGGKVRLLGRYKEYITLEVNYSYDKLFHNVVQGSLAFTLPFGRKLQRCGKCCPQTDNLLLSRAAFAPSRLEIPVVKRVRRSETAINPATGNPWVVWFVNNTSHSAGTFESPFPTLLQAQNASSPDQMIYVFPGDGTTNGMNAGITLQDGQSFFGSGVNQQFATTKGTKTIPAMSSSNPSITNTTGSVVTVGNGNVVSGFNISVASGNGVANVGSVNGATIANNSFTCVPNNTSGVGLNGFGNFNIYNNQFTASASNVLGSAITLISSGGRMSGIINNNTSFGFLGGFMSFEGDSSYDFTIVGNTFTNFAGTAIGVRMSGDSTIRIIGNTLDSSVGIAGIFAQYGTATTGGTLVITNNQMNLPSPNAADGILLTDVMSNVTISNNFVQSNQAAGFNGIGVNAGSAPGSSIPTCLKIDNNTIETVPGSRAFNFITFGSGVLKIESCQGNTGDVVLSSGNVNLVLPGTCGN